MSSNFESAKEKRAINDKLNVPKLSIWRTLAYICVWFFIPFVSFVILPALVKLLILPKAGYLELIKQSFGWVGGVGLFGLIVVIFVKSFPWKK